MTSGVGGGGSAGFDDFGLGPTGLSRRNDNTDPNWGGGDNNGDHRLIRSMNGNNYGDHHHHHQQQQQQRNGKSTMENVSSTRSEGMVESWICSSD